MENGAKMHEKMLKMIHAYNSDIRSKEFSTEESATICAIITSRLLHKISALSQLAEYLAVNINQV